MNAENIFTFHQAMRQSAKMILDAIASELQVPFAYCASFVCSTRLIVRFSIACGLRFAICELFGFCKQCQPQRQHYRARQQR
jgi:hypothetical protein